MSEAEVLTQIQVALGKIQVITENTERRISGIEQRLDAYVPRKEIEATTDGLESRVKGLEDNAQKVMWYVIGLLVTTISSGVGLGVTIFLKTMH